MSALASIKTLFDASTLNLNADMTDTTPPWAARGLTTGANTKSLTPFGPNLQGIQRWAYTGGGIALGYPVFTMGIRSPTKNSRINKVSAKVVLPVLEQTSASTASGIQPAPTKAYDLTAVMDFLLPERSTATERTALLSIVLSLLVQELQDSAGANAMATATPLVSAIISDDRPY